MLVQRSSAFLLTLLATVCLLGSIPGQDPTPGPDQAPTWRARLPARVIAGRLIVRCDVSTTERRLPLNLFFDYDRQCGLELHNKAAFALGAERDAAEGAGLPIRIHLEGHDIAVERREHGDEDLLDEFTRLYSRELLENACAGAIGSKVLADYHVTFELGEGAIWLEPARPELAEPPVEVEGTTQVPRSQTRATWHPGPPRRNAPFMRHDALRARRQILRVARRSRAREAQMSQR